MNFDESVKYLYGLGNEVLAMKLGLESIGLLLAELGNPHTSYRKIQIAGTNGKGSTVAFLESICREAGMRVGATTSPHLISVTERVRIDGEPISNDAFAMLATRVRAVSETLVEAGRLENVPTFFEQVTAIALLAFAEAVVEIAILETGLGGRFDATTAAGADTVAITRIAFDHQRILGGTIERIAAEKAAIIGPEKTVVVANQPEEAFEVLLDRCLEVGVVPRFSSELNVGFDQNAIVFESKQVCYRVPHLGLAGDHQFENATTAVLLAESLGIRKDAIESGLANAVHHGRLERRGRFLLDGAHNENGAEALQKYLLESVPRPIVMIFGAMRDKELEGIESRLFPMAKTVIVTRAENQRSMDPAELASSARLFSSDVREARSVSEALNLAAQAAPNGSTIVVTGSLYLVGEALAIIDEHS